VEKRSQSNDGFTLVEILVAIVLVGVLSAVVVVGISRLTDKASAASCTASADAARAASLASFTQRSTYPTSFADLTNALGATPSLLVLPTGATAIGRTVATKDWTLTMSTPTSMPPTFTCGPAGGGEPSTTAAPTTAAPTTAAPTTAATLPPAPESNGVTVIASTRGDGKYYGENILSVSNKAEITAMTIKISLQQDVGMKFNTQYNTAWSDTVEQSYTSSKTLEYSFDLRAKSTIVPGSWMFVGTWSLDGTLHVAKGDTWTITTTSSGITQTLSGAF
jgi:prepilin-type N-terminal cleavage/methylation domain-containing protein